MRGLLVLLPLLLLGLKASAQVFYAVSTINYPVGNRAFHMNVNACDSVEDFFCLPTNDTNQYFQNVYTDIAIDRNNNVYYVSAWGSLYKRALTDSTSCVYLGSFPGSVNAMVVDSQNTLYAVGTQNSISTLYRFDLSLNTFSTVGNFPVGFYSSGDLLFYEGRLFMTCTNSYFTSSFLIEVSLPDPAGSCYYMDLQNLQPYGAFSLYDNSNSRAFILSKTTNSTSALQEIDIPGKTILSPICHYPFLVAGAAAYYNLTSTDKSCVPNSVNSPLSTKAYFTVSNPVFTTLRFFTNVKLSEIDRIRIFNMAGYEVWVNTNSQASNHIDVSNIVPGLYLIQLVTHTGHRYQQSFIIADH
jgi:hypothetical protein